jgi:hypothetical protein
MDREDFHVEHVIAKKHRGSDDLGNLAWACIFCNLYKGPNLASLDPDSGELTRVWMFGMNISVWMVRALSALLR